IFTTDIGRETLALNDGWASTSPGTTGGSGVGMPGVTPIVSNVTDRLGLVAAIANISGNPPRIIYVHGTIDGNTDDNNQEVDSNHQPLYCRAYRRSGYTLEGYVADPAGMEAARAASVLVQRARMRLDLRSNTTIVGVGRDAHL